MAAAGRILSRSAEEGVEGLGHNVRSAPTAVSADGSGMIAVPALCIRHDRSPRGNSEDFTIPFSAFSSQGLTDSNSTHDAVSQKAPYVIRSVSVDTAVSATVAPIIRPTIHVISRDSRLAKSSLVAAFSWRVSSLTRRSSLIIGVIAHSPVLPLSPGRSYCRIHLPSRRRAVGAGPADHPPPSHAADGGDRLLAVEAAAVIDVEAAQVLGHQLDTVAAPGNVIGIAGVDGQPGLGPAERPPPRPVVNHVLSGHTHPPFHSAFSAYEGIASAPASMAFLTVVLETFFSFAIWRRE